MKKIVQFSVAGLLLLLASTVQAATWGVPGDFATIQDAIDSDLVSDGDSILVGPGAHSGADVYKSVEIKGDGNAVIIDGPLHRYGLTQGFRLLTGSDGATISHLVFDGVDLSVMNAESANDVTVTQSTFLGAVQAVSNWRGSGWEISHNIITDLRTQCGGGIGILIADANGGLVSDNVVSHNRISGTLHVSDGDCGGYNGSGIVLYADFRWNREGTDAISFNRVVKNKISLVSDTPAVVDIAAIELTEASAPESESVFIFSNSIGFNDMRGTEMQLVLTPDSLAEVNWISKNLGDSRGGGAHPALFTPGGN